MAKKTYINRALEPSLTAAAAEFAVVAILGPRQSGKTTLARHRFPHHRYISLEDYDIRERANTDPRGFLTDYPSASGIILDEIQHVPQLLSYIQTIIDLAPPAKKLRGFFIITGSQNFLLNQAISQSLAGRITILTLLPLSLAELSRANLLPDNIESLIFNGSYPALYTEKRSTTRLYQSYINTYLERDVRQLKQIADLNLFKKFLALCAGRSGQEVNYQALSNDCGLDDKTVKAWLSVLEASYVIFLLPPYYQNFGKRLIKSPKLYFIDTGLACTLLRIKSADELHESAHRGPLIETLVIADLLKQQYNLELLPSLYFWRDQTGHQIDCVIDEGRLVVPLEIKASKTVISSFFKNAHYWQELIKADATKRSTNFYIVYGGNENQRWPAGQVVSWAQVGDLIAKLIKQAV